MATRLNLVLPLLVGAALCVGFTPRSYAVSIQEITASVNKNADEFQKLKEMMNSPDSSIRLATYKALLGSDDPLQRQLAVESGLVSADAIVQGVVVSGLVAKKKTIAFVFEPDEKTPKAGKEFAAKHGNLITAQIEEYSQEDGTFRISVLGFSGQGQFSGATYSFRAGSYSGQLSVSDAVLKGSFRCGDSCAVPTSVSLQ